MTQPVTIIGSRNGSTMAKAHLSQHNRVVVDLTTDFGEVRGVFDRKRAADLGRALLALSGEPA